MPVLMAATRRTPVQGIVQKIRNRNITGLRIQSHLLKITGNLDQTAMTAIVFF